MTTGTVRVLTADDSAFSHKIIASHLSGTEFSVVGNARNGREAVAKFNELKPDILLLDIIMPEVSGIEALKTIMETDSSAKVIMLSSLGTEDAVTECLNLGAKSFIQKPFDRDVLTNCLRAVIKPS